MIAISPGHYSKAKGAHDRDAFFEYPETLKWVQLIREHLDRLGVRSMLVPAEDLGAKVAFVNKAVKHSGIRLAVEVHFNSCPGGGAKGSETLFCPGSIKGKQAARIVQGHMSTFMAPNRGVKEGWYKMDRPGIQDFPGDKEGDEKPDYFLRATDCTAIILEPEFIQNRATIEDNREIVCEVIAEALQEVITTQTV